jgi:hypothetical protein
MGTVLRTYPSHTEVLLARRLGVSAAMIGLIARIDAWCSFDWCTNTNKLKIKNEVLYGLILGFFAWHVRSALIRHPYTRLFQQRPRIPILCICACAHINTTHGQSVVPPNHIILIPENPIARPLARTSTLHAREF